MTPRSKIAVCAVMIACLSTQVTPNAGQTAAAASKSIVGQASQKSPRTPWGDPDLQGIWTNGETMDVPVERPGQFGTREYLTDAELAERQQNSKLRGNRNPGGRVTEGDL